MVGVWSVVGKDQELTEECRGVFCLACSVFFSRPRIILLTSYLFFFFKVTTVTSSQCLFFRYFSYGVYYWLFFSNPSSSNSFFSNPQLPSGLGQCCSSCSRWGPIRCVLGDMRDVRYTSPEMLYTYTCTCAQRLVSVGVDISSLNVIMPFKKAQKLALEEEDSRFGIILISCGRSA